MAQPALPDTPFRKNRYSQQTNLLAKPLHQLSDRAVDAQGMDQYICRVKAAFPSSTAWDTIAENEEIKAARDFLLQHNASELEKARYGPATRLLNLVSLSVFDAIKDTRSSEDRDIAVLFTSRPSNVPRGDILDTRLCPDYPSFSGSRKELVEATKQATFRPQEIHPWPVLGSVGEQKRSGGLGKHSGQFKSYMTTLKRYRPDLPTVVGMIANHKSIQLAHLNACGMWTSAPAKMADSLDPFIAFVFFVYQSHDERDKRLRYDPQQKYFVRWDIIDTTAPVSEKTYAMTPFYTARAPGRATFAAFQVAEGPIDQRDVETTFYASAKESQVQGFWKTSWQQRKKSTERVLLDRAHGPGRWIPGLVRPYPKTSDEPLVVPTPADPIRQAPLLPLASSWTDEPTTPVDEGSDEESLLETTSTGDGTADEGQFLSQSSLSSQDIAFVERVQEVIHIGSIGEPLSQCDTPRELLFAAYDVLETHENLWEHGVLHRDVSWFNVMCKPIHYVGGDPTEQERPCIKKILSEIVHFPDGEPLVSSALLGDLDHAVDTTDLDRDSHLRDRTGTAMFISTQLGDPKGINYSPNTSYHRTLILDALRWIDADERGGAILQRAFPHGDGGFMAKLNTVFELENSRRKPLRLPERPVHRPRHDAESIFWVFLWAFCRAQPRGGPAEVKTPEINKLGYFGDMLLAHEVGDPHEHGKGLEKDRVKCFLDPLELEELFHPAFARFEELFVAMAAYWYIPWHLYEGIIDANHAHIAYRRMLLGFVLKTDAALLDILLDTERPRIIHPPVDHEIERKSANPSGSRASATAASGASKKRKTPSSAHDSGPPGKKRAGLGQKALVPGIPTVDTSKDASSDQSLPQAAKKYKHELHADLRSAFALCLKVWKDRTVWFCRGVSN